MNITITNLNDVVSNFFSPNNFHAPMMTWVNFETGTHVSANTWTVDCNPVEMDVFTFPENCTFTVSHNGINEDDPSATTVVFKLETVIDGVGHYKYTKAAFKSLTDSFKVLHILSNLFKSDWKQAAVSKGVNRDDRIRLRSLDSIFEGHWETIKGFLSKVFTVNPVVKSLVEPNHSDKGRDRRASANVTIASGSTANISLAASCPLALNKWEDATINVKLDLEDISLKTYAKIHRILVTGE